MAVQEAAFQFLHLKAAREQRCYRASHTNKFLGAVCFHFVSNAEVNKEINKSENCCCLYLKLIQEVINRAMALSVHRMFYCALCIEKSINQVVQSPIQSKPGWMGL